MINNFIEFENHQVRTTQRSTKKDSRSQIGVTTINLSLDIVIELSDHAIDRRYRYGADMITEDEILVTIERAIPEIQAKMSRRQVHVRKTDPDKQGNYDPKFTIKDKRTGLCVVAIFGIVATEIPSIYIVTVYKNLDYYPSHPVARKYFVQV